MKRHHIAAVLVITGTAAFTFNSGCREESAKRKTPSATANTDFVRLMNLGKGYLENRDATNAVPTLTDALKQNPNSAPALRNLARALLISKKPEDAAQAVENLNKSLDRDPDNPATHYLLGLANNRLEYYDKALPSFERAVQLDPETANLRFQLARALENNGDYERAGEQLRETLRLDPLNRYAHHRLAAHGRRNRDREAITHHTQEYARIRYLLGEQPEEVLEQCKHTAPEPTPIDNLDITPTPTINVTFADATGEFLPNAKDLSLTTIALLEMDGAGVPTLLTATKDGAIVAIKVSDRGAFEQSEAISAGDTGSAQVTQILPGDFYVEITEQTKTMPHRDARNDCLLVTESGILAFRRDPSGAFHALSETTGLENVKANRAAWIDYDHDGDIDLLLATDVGPKLFQNNGFAQNVGVVGQDDSVVAKSKMGPPHFKDVTSEVGIQLSEAVTDAIPVEWDNNVAIDLVAAGPDATRVFINQRAGKFAPMPEPPGPWPAASRLTSNDLNNDGFADVLLLNDNTVTLLDGATGQRKSIPAPDFGLSGATLLDHDNDGRLDILLYGSNQTALLRNDPKSGFTDISTATTIDAIQTPDPIREIAAADFDNDGDSDIFLISTDGAPRFLRNDGGNANQMLKLNLVTILTNPTGVGAHIELRRLDQWITRTINAPVIEIGLGNTSELDTLQIVWTNGVVDNEFRAPVSNQPFEIVEKMVELGSCPFLFAWDGNRFRFVTDILGNSPLGLSIERDVTLQADPDELVYIGDERDFKPRDGKYVLQTLECYREAFYFDSARLIAVDHPESIEPHATDKLMPPPFPPSDIWTLTNLRPATSVIGDDGIDRTTDLREIDNEFAPIAKRLPAPYRGMCQPLTLTMDFGQLDPAAENVLALTGWLRYGSAGVNIALSQNDRLSVIPPTLEAQTADGSWSHIHVTVGMPAGKTKTILTDLTGKLPPDTQKLRLTSTFEIRWDRIALGRRAPLEPANVHTLTPDSADLHWIGFPEMSANGPDLPITPDHDRRSDQPKWRRTPQGWCTRYGPVLELIAESDEKIAILNGGDAATITFDANALPPVPENYKRTFFFLCVGWEKDGDHNVIHGDTIHPLPIETTESEENPLENWQLRYNTRFTPGAMFDDRQ